jgi:uncharacterized protein (TIGR03905 family)
MYSIECPTHKAHHILRLEHRERKGNKMTYKTSGVCSQEISFEIDETTGTVRALTFTGGCSGNTGGISRLVVGMTVDEVIQRLEGVTCGFRPTSCPDQLAKALKEWRSHQ